MKEISEAARQARNKYHREYYAAHKDKFREYRITAWERIAEREKEKQEDKPAEREADKE